MMGLRVHSTSDCAWFAKREPPYCVEERLAPATGEDGPRDCPVLLLGGGGICDLPLPRGEDVEATGAVERPPALVLAPAPTATGRASVSALAGSCDEVPLAVSPSGTSAASVRGRRYPVM